MLSRKAVAAETAPQDLGDRYGIVEHYSGKLSDGATLIIWGVVAIRGRGFCPVRYFRRALAPCGRHGAASRREWHSLRARPRRR